MSSPKPAFKIVKPDEFLSAFTDTPIGTASASHDLASVPFEYGPKALINGVTFSVTAGGLLTSSVFSRAGDVDEDGVLVPAAKGEPAPPLELNEASAWLKYRCSAAVSGKVKAGDAFVVEGDRSVIFASYHVHDRNVLLRTAVIKDLVNLQELRLAANIADVMKLQPKEALAFRVHGTLGATISLNWADVFAGQLGFLSEFVPDRTAVGIEIKANAGFTGSVRITDDFTVSFARTETNDFRIAVKKARLSRLSAGAGANIEARLTNPTDVEQVLDNVVQGLSGFSEKTITALLAKARLTKNELTILNAVQTRFGIPDLAQLSAKWDSLKKEIAKKIQTAAESKLQAGFTYEYSRTKTESVFLQAIVAAGPLQSFHQDLMLCRLGAITEHVRSGKPGVRLEDYLKETTIQRSQSWGFTLGIGKWKIWSKDQKQLSSTTQENIAGRRQVAYEGFRAYNDDEKGWSADVKAEMPAFSASPAPLASEFTLGLHLHYEWKESKYREDRLREFLDYAMVWKVLSATDEEDIVQKLKPMAKSEKVELHLDLTFSDDAIRAVVQSLPPNMEEYFARALARSMPWWKVTKSRQIISERESVYAPLWKYYLSTGGQEPPKRYARYASSQMSAGPAGKDMAFLENADNYTRSRPYTFAGLIELNSSTFVDWKSFSSGLASLKAVSDPKAPYVMVERSLGSMLKLFAQSHHTRAVGALLLDLAALAGVPESGIHRSFVVRNAGKEQIYGTLLK
jgi:hypothetical protein